MQENTYSFRPATDDDMTVIAGFPQSEEELYYMFPKASFPLTAKQLAEAKQPRFEATVVECRGAVVGYANFYEAIPGKHCSIGNLVVHPLFRNQGVATFLIVTMEQLARQKYAASEVHISCFNPNTNGLLLYTKLGYKPYDIERRLKHNGDPIALVEMKKVI